MSEPPTPTRFQILQVNACATAKATALMSFAVAALGGAAVLLFLAAEYAWAWADLAPRTVESLGDWFTYIFFGGIGLVAVIAMAIGIYGIGQSEYRDACYRCVVEEHRRFPWSRPKSS